MKKLFTWTVNVSLIFIAASALTYTIHYYIFQDPHHIFIYMIGDFGFLFIDVLLVVLFIERILSHREKKALMKKLNMAIGTFFSEVGIEFLKKFSAFVENSEELAKKLIITSQWSSKDFAQAVKEVHDFSYNIKLDKDKLVELRDFLVGKRNFMLVLLENPNLLEHDSFTDLMWAIFHLSEELTLREDKIKSLPRADYNHLMLDLKRAYSQVMAAWVSYMNHMQGSYPFLFSLASRINPMNPDASPIISD